MLVYTHRYIGRSQYVTLKDQSNGETKFVGLLDTVFFFVATTSTSWARSDCLVVER